MPKATPQTPTPPWYRIAARDDGDPPDAPVEIFIFGDIGESFWGEETVTARQFVKDLGALDPAASLLVRINSFGGSVVDATAIYNALRRHQGPVATSNEGAAISAASLIFMAGDSRAMASTAHLMIHAPWGVAVGNAPDMREMAETLDRFAMAMVGPYARSGMASDDVVDLLTDGEDHWFSAAEARAAGFVTEIVDATDAAARYRNNRFVAARSPGRQPTPSPTRADFHSTLARIYAMPKPVTPGVDDSTNPPNAATQDPPPAPNVTDIEAAAAARERDRIKARAATVRGMFAPFMAVDGIPDLLNAALDDPTESVDAVSAKLLAKLGESTKPLAHGATITPGEDAADKFRAGMIGAIRARAGLEKHDPQNEWTGRRLTELARACLEARGVNTRGMHLDDIARSALRRSPFGSAPGQSTSDFDVILEATIHRTLVEQYRIAPDTWSKICVTGSVSDLRSWSRIITGTIGDIDTVNENGEYKFKTIPDGAKESVSAVRRGNRLAVTPDVIINDDLGFFSRVPADFGRAAKRTIETAFYSLLTSNSGVGPTMLEDSKAMFHTDHGNYVTSGAAPSVATVSAGRLAMAAQKDLSGNEILDLTPAIWVGPKSLGDAVRTLQNSEYDPDTSGKGNQRWNPIRGAFSAIIDTGRLTGTGWYLFADPAIAPAFEVVFLEGQTEPKLSQEEDFATAGLVWRVELPFGVGAIGWRGAYYNDGAT